MFVISGTDSVIYRRHVHIVCLQSRPRLTVTDMSSAVTVRSWTPCNLNGCQASSRPMEVFLGCSSYILERTSIYGKSGCHGGEYEDDRSEVLRRKLPKKLTNVSQMLTAIIKTIVKAADISETLIVSTRLQAAISQKTSLDIYFKTCFIYNLGVFTNKRAVLQYQKPNITTTISGHYCSFAGCSEFICRTRFKYTKLSN